MALAAPTVSPVTDSDKHLITILVEAEAGATLVKLERREHYTKVETVRGSENTLMTEDSIFVADYEAAQNVTVEYKATVEKDGQTAESDWVLADNLDTGSDYFFTLDNPYIGMPVNVERNDVNRFAAPRTVVKVWGRPDPVVVSGVREMPSGTLVLITLSLSERDQLLDNLESGQLCALSPRYPSEGLPDVTYLSIGMLDLSRTSPYVFEDSRRFTMEYQTVKAPPAFWRYPLEESNTWGDVLTNYANWQAVANESWREIVGI